MKKLLIIIIIVLLFFLACDNNENNNNTDQSTTLTITNSTDFNGIQPFYGDVVFGMLNRGQTISKEVEEGLNYIFIMLTAMSTAEGLGEHTSMWDISDAVVCEKNKNNTLTITNNTNVSFSGGNTEYINSGGSAKGTLKALFDAYIAYMNTH